MEHNEQIKNDTSKGEIRDPFMIPNVFEGPISKATCQIAIPIMISSILSFVYILVDTYFVSLINPTSPAPLAGMALIFPISMVFSSLASCLGAGISTATGRIVGEEKAESSSSLGSTGLVLCLMSGLPIITLCYLFGDSILQVLAGSEMTVEALKYGTEFLYGVAPGMFLMSVSFIYGGILQGQGLAVFSAISMLIMTIANLILSPLLIFVFDMGVFGAGLATTISIAISLLYIVTIMKNGPSKIPLSFQLSSFNKNLAKEILKIGMPQVLIATSMSIVVVSFNKVMGNISEEAMFAWALVGRFDQLVLIPIMAIASATAVLVSQNYGRNKIDRIKEIFKTNAVMAIVMSGFLAVLYISIAPWLFTKFAETKGVVELAVTQVRIVAFTTLAFGVSVIASACFQSTNRPLPSVIIFMLKAIFTVILGMFLCLQLEMGVFGIYIALAIANLTLAPLSYFWFKNHLKTVQFKAINS